MKKLINNKKGFTLIELLAVIVILAILVMVSIPAVMRYLDTARKGTFSDAAATAVSAVRNDVIINGIQGKKTYTLGKATDGKYPDGTINSLLEQKLTNSPYGKPYNESSYITVDVNNESTKYYICLVDGDKKGIKVESTKIDKSKVEDNVTCAEASDTWPDSNS